MKRTIIYLVYTLLTAVVLTSCGKGESLQRYYVDHQEAKNFISQDIPLSMMKIDKTNFTEDQNEAYKSVSKLNFLGYKTNETDTQQKQYVDDWNKRAIKFWEKLGYIKLT